MLVAAAIVLVAAGLFAIGMRAYRAAACDLLELERMEVQAAELRSRGMAQGWSDPALDDELRRAEGIRRSRLRDASIRRGRAAQAARRAR